MDERIRNISEEIDYLASVGNNEIMNKMQSEKNKEETKAAVELLKEISEKIKNLSTNTEESLKNISEEIKYLADVGKSEISERIKNEWNRNELNTAMELLTEISTELKSMSEDIAKKNEQIINNNEKENKKEGSVEEPTLIEENPDIKRANDVWQQLIAATSTNDNINDNATENKPVENSEDYLDTELTEEEIKEMDEQHDKKLEEEKGRVVNQTTEENSTVHDNNPEHTTEDSESKDDKVIDVPYEVTGVRKAVKNIKKKVLVGIAALAAALVMISSGVKIRNEIKHSQLPSYKAEIQTSDYDISFGDTVNLNERVIYVNEYDAFLENNAQHAFYDENQERVIVGSAFWNDETGMERVYAYEEDAQVKIDDILENGGELAAVVTANKNFYDGNKPLTEEEYKAVREGWEPVSNINVLNDTLQNTRGGRI